MTTLAEERKTSEEDLLSPPRVLEALTGLLGFRHLADEKQPCNQKWCQIQWEGEGIFPQNAIAGQTCNDTDFDFSSFPSLSILKKGTTSGASSEAHFHHKEAVTAHCASLMSRPILVSSDPESKLYEDDQDEDEGFMAQRISDVPLMMQQNLTTAFSALVQSRLRAYATFLARHGLAMAECSETAHELEEGVVGIEQKLEMMRQLGSLVCLEDSETSFHAVKEGLVSEEEEEDRKIALPLRMIASYNILIPTIEGEAERLKISFETLGSITGKYTRYILYSLY